MGSIFPRPPARAGLADLEATKVALEAGADADSRARARAPVLICLGAERTGLSGPRSAGFDARARIPMRPGGPSR